MKLTPRIWLRRNDGALALCSTDTLETVLEAGGDR